MSARLDVIELVVADMARALAFYRRLGLEFPEGAESEGHVEATLPGGLRFMLDTEAVMRSFDPEWNASAPGRIGLAFRCDDASDVDRLYAEFVRAGYEGHKEPWDAFWGQRYAQLKDPDGNGVDLFAPLQTSA